MELDLGQQITLIGSTPEERVMRAAFVPCSERGEPGVMEVVSEKNNPDDPSVRILDTLAIGETIQVNMHACSSPSSPPLSHSLKSFHTFRCSPTRRSVPRSCLEASSRLCPRLTSARLPSLPPFPHQATPGVRLTNRHPGPINKLLIVVSKLGVVPALQFLKALLPTTSGYSVDFANVVWVNERQDQYILQEELQALFYKYNRFVEGLLFFPPFPLSFW